MPSKKTSTKAGKLKNVNVRLPEDLYRRLRIFGLQRGLVVQGLVAEAIATFLQGRES